MMTQEERWEKRYQEVMKFIVKYKRNPSKHRIEEHDMLNWIKHNRKLLNARTLKEDRIELFAELLSKMEEIKRLNQYV